MREIRQWKYHEKAPQVYLHHCFEICTICFIYMARLYSVEWHHCWEKLFTLWYTFIIFDLLLYPLFILSICWTQDLLCSSYVVVSRCSGRSLNTSKADKVHIGDLHWRSFLWTANGIEQLDMQTWKIWAYIILPSSWRWNTKHMSNQINNENIVFI